MSPPHLSVLNGKIQMRTSHCMVLNEVPATMVTDQKAGKGREVALTTNEKIVLQKNRTINSNGANQKIMSNLKAS